MQQNKSIKNLSEIKNYTSNNSLLLSTYTRVLKYFNLWGINRMLKIKQSGLSARHLFQTLIVLPFLQIDNIYNLFLCGIQDQVVGCKNTFYRFMQHDMVPWRNILYAFARQFSLRTAERCGSETTARRCLILDDTIISKTGKKIEYTGRLYDHSSHRYLRGYKGLFAGFWDGKSFIPLDFSLHQEGNLTQAEQQKQSSYRRASQSPAHRRVKEVRESKISQSIEMVKKAISQGFSPEYVLADSWFMCHDFIDQIHNLHGTEANGPHVLGLFKMNRKVEWHERTYKLHALPALRKKRQRHCKSLGCMYIPLSVTYKGLQLKVFLIRMKGENQWKTLATTDHTLSFIEAMKTYAIRWSIEVFFKDMKQHLQLGKCQSQHFNAQIADTTIRCIQYIVLAFARRHDAYESIGGMFEHLKEKLLQEHLIQRLWRLLKTIYKEILMQFGVPFDTFMHQIINSNKIRLCFQSMLNLLQSSKIENPPPKAIL